MILRLHAHLDDTALASEATQKAIGGVEGLRQRGMDYGGGGQNVLIDFYSLFNSSLALAARSAVVYTARTSAGSSLTSHWSVSWLKFTTRNLLLN